MPNQVVYPPIAGTPATAPLPVPYAPAAAYGYDPSGQPLSDKSKIVAGLLQLLLGFFFALGGVGRLYAGHTGLGVAQLVTSVVGWICVLVRASLAHPSPGSSRAQSGCGS